MRGEMRNAGHLCHVKTLIPVGAGKGNHSGFRASSVTSPKILSCKEVRSGWMRESLPNILIKAPFQSTVINFIDRIINDLVNI